MSKKWHPVEVLSGHSQRKCSICSYRPFSYDQAETVDLDLLIDQGSIWSPFLSAEDEPFMRCKLQIDAVRPFAAPMHCRALWLHLDPDWPVQNWPSGSVKDWPDITGRRVTDWLEVWRIDQKLQTWHGKHRPEGIDQKCEGLTRSMSLKHDWSEVISSVKKCCEGLTRSVKDWPEVCVWNMIDQKCEGLTRIDTENSFQFDQLRALKDVAAPSRPDVAVGMSQCLLKIELNPYYVFSSFLPKQFLSGSCWS